MSENTNDLNEVFEIDFAEAEVVTVPIDDTLSNSGEAADAAAVGAALALKANLSDVVSIDVNGQAADNQGHILVDGSEIQMGGTDTRTLKAAVEAAEGRTGANIPLSSASDAPTIAEAVEAAGMATAATIPMSATDTTTVGAKIGAMETTAQTQGAAITALQGKTAETMLLQAGSLQTVKEAIGERVKTVNGQGADSSGNVELRSVPAAENLVSEMGTSVEGTFGTRTAGGTASIENGDAWLMDIKGNSQHTGYSAEVLTMTVTETGETGHMSAAIDRDAWAGAVYEDGTYSFVYSTAWTLGGSEVTISDYGITVTGEPEAGDTIAVVWAEEVRGTIIQATPSLFIATGWNLYNHAVGYAHVMKYSDIYGFGVAGTYTKLQYSATYSGTKSDITVTSGRFTIPADGYIWVTGGNSTDTAIWMTWSDWTEGYSGSFAAYAESQVNLSSVMSTVFPYGLMKAGSVCDEINLNIGTAYKRVERVIYSAEARATAAASGREYEFDEDYVYIAMAEPETVSVEVDGGYRVNDHGLEAFGGSGVPIPTETLYGANLKNKLERDVLTISAQSLTGSEKMQVQKNIGLCSKVWMPSSGETLISYILGNVSRSGLPFSAIKVGTTTVSDTPFTTEEYTILVYGCYDRMTVELQLYGTNGKLWTRSIWQNAWQTSGSWVCPADQAIIAEEYSFSYTNLTTAQNITASDLNIVAKSGYTLVGIVGFATGSSAVFAYGIQASTSGTVASIRNSTNTAASGTVRVKGLWVKNTLL